MLLTIFGVAFLFASMEYKGMFIPGCVWLLVGVLGMILNILITKEEWTAPSPSNSTSRQDLNAAHAAERTNPRVSLLATGVTIVLGRSGMLSTLNTDQRIFYDLPLLSS